MCKICYEISWRRQPREKARLDLLYLTPHGDFVLINSFCASISSTLIDSLDSEREELDTMLAKMETNQNKAADDSNTRQLQVLSKTEKEFQAMVKEESDQIKALELEVKTLYNSSRYWE